MLKPPRSILDPLFKYEPAKTHSSADYLREKLRKIRDEIQGPRAVVTPIKKRKP